MIDRRTCLALREKLALLEKTSKKPRKTSKRSQPGDSPTEKTQGENASADGASLEARKNSGEFGIELEPGARYVPPPAVVPADAPAQPKSSRKVK